MGANRGRAFYGEAILSPGGVLVASNALLATKDALRSHGTHLEPIWPPRLEILILSYSVTDHDP